MARTGRPKKPTEELKVNKIWIMVTLEERAQIDAAANMDGLQTSTWARQQLLRLAREKAAKAEKRAAKEKPFAK